MNISNTSDRNWELRYLNLQSVSHIHYQDHPSVLIEKALLAREGVLTDTGALAVDTGEFTGRSPQDRFIVRDDQTTERVWWGDVNIPFDPDAFDHLYERVCSYLTQREVYIRDVAACSDERFRLSIRVITEFAFQNLFSANLFIPVAHPELSQQPEWTIVAVPGFKADPERDRTRSHNFSIINFSRKIILIGGTAYTGEIKKAIFSVLNFTLPVQRGILPMHCSANIGQAGDTAIFFGLSGTGKTTLSADPERNLVGDDEHGWSNEGVFNFEGGCYAKCVDLSFEKEPQIFNAVRFGALLENTRFVPGTRTVNFTDISVTENTRVAYPLHYISNSVAGGRGPEPQHIFFLTADAFGVLPAISRLNRFQAMYHFISGYTAKVAGTEAGVKEPKATFSACFGKAFLPLHPAEYAELLGKRIDNSDVRVWLINTGWNGGPYGLGKRMELKYTRAMIKAALTDALDQVDFREHPIFGLAVPVSCPGVPDQLLDPKSTWDDPYSYDQKASELASAFVSNFRQFEEGVDSKVIKAAPQPAVYI